jgi:hypothetical protein
MQNINKQLRIAAIVNGIALGIILLVLYVLQCYLILAFNTSLMLIGIVVPIALFFISPIVATILLCSNLRKKIGGYWTVRQATTGFFIMFLMGFLILNLGKAVLFKAVDKNLNDKLKRSYVTANIIAWKQMHHTPAEIDKRVKDIQQTDYSELQGITVATILPRIATLIILLFVVALIFAAFYKRPLPVLPYADSELDPTV